MARSKEDKEIPIELEQKGSRSTIILYVLTKFGPQSREAFINPINTTRNGKTSKMSTNTFTSETKSLLSEGFINKNTDKKKYLYSITKKGLSELITKLRNVDIKLDILIQIKQQHVRNFIESYREFFSEFSIKEERIKLDFLDLANEINIDKFAIFKENENKFNSLILFLILNQPKYYLLHSISKEEFLLKYNIVTDAEMAIFLEKVVKEDIYDLNFYTLDPKKNGYILYFWMNSHHGKLFENTLKNKVNELHMRKILINQDPNLNIFDLKEIQQDITNLFISNFMKYDFDLEMIINQLTEAYLYKNIFNLKDRIIISKSDDLSPLSYFASHVSLQGFKNIKKHLFDPSTTSLNLIDLLNSNEIRSKYFQEKNLNLINSMITLLEKSLLKEFKDSVRRNIQEFDAIEINFLQYIQSLKEKNFKKSLQIANSMIKNDPKDFIGILFKAKSLFEKEKYEDSLDVINIKLPLFQNNKYIIWMKCAILEQLERNEEALENINNILQTSPNEFTSYSIKVMILESLEKYNEALETIEKSILLHPRGYFLKSYILFIMGKDKEALQSIDNAIKLNPDFPNGGELKSLILVKMGEKKELMDHKEALELIDKGINLSPKIPMGYTTKSEILSRIGRADEALKLVDKAIKLNPNIPEGYTAKSKILSRLGRVDEALNILDKIINLFPDLPDVHIAKSEILLNMGKPNEALLLIDKEINLFPNFPQGYAIKTEILMKMDRNEEALESIEKAIDLDKNNPVGYALKSMLLLMMGNREESFRIINETIELNQNYSLGYVLKSFHLAKLGKHDEALKTIDKAIDLYPEIPEYDFEVPMVYELKSEILFKKEKYEEALKSLENIIELGLSGNELKSKILLKLERNEEALETVEKIIDLKPDYSLGYALKSKILLNMERNEDALENIENAIEIIPHNPLNFINKGEILLKMEKYEEAIEELKNAKKIDPDIFIGSLQSDLLLLMGKPDEALKIINKTIELEPKLEERYLIKSNILFNLGKNEENLEFLIESINYLIAENISPLQLINKKIYLHLNRKEKANALAEAEKLISLDPQSGQYYDTYGEILLEFGDYELALNKFQKSIELEKNMLWCYETYLKASVCYKALGNDKKSKEFFQIGQKNAPKEDEWVEKAKDKIKELENKQKSEDK